MQKIRPDMDIGKNIQAIRYQNKLTQDQVIAKLNLMGISMSKSTYAKLETNTDVASPMLIYKNRADEL